MLNVIGGLGGSAEGLPRVEPRRAPLALRVLLLAVALGVVLMHHLVAAHQHPGSTSPSGAAQQVMSAPVGPSAHAASVPADVGAEHTSSSGTPAFLHVHHGMPGGDMTGVLHECLAVLVAAAIAVALALVGRFAGAQGVLAIQVTIRTRGEWQQAAPVPLRLAQLQVLRL